jgi:predicted dehydrogenase/threonine dehydrogenase-like Zn-dependent dehydrogenase
MKQVLHHLGTGNLRNQDVPCPQVGPNQLLIETRASLISPGTERMLIEFGRSGWIQKARQQPEKLRQVIQKARTDGLLATYESVHAKLDREIALGYANAGVVAAVGRQVARWRPGDRVVSNGAHAEMVAVPATLCTPIPLGVPDLEAPFAVLGSIALQGVRLLAPTLGERFVVTGLGLVGLLAAQLLRQSGCRVLGLDPHPGRRKLAERWGVETLAPGEGLDIQQTLARAAEFSGGHGVDGVLIAAATSSTEPIEQAAEMCRVRGRIVLTGVAGLQLSRDLFYRKELSFQVSCSYGPGRYDDSYEQDGHDYPRGHVRWTAQRNMAAALDLMADGRLEISPLISHRFRFTEAERAYAVLAREASLGVVLEYSPGGPGRDAQGSGATTKLDTSIVLSECGGRSKHISPAKGSSRSGSAARAAVVGLFGAGEYAGKVLLPALSAAGARLDTVVSSTGVGAASAGRRFGFARAASDEESILANPGIDTVVIATRHNSHARLAAAALRAGKSVWVEKPLALTLAELETVTEAWLAAPSPRLMVGFNRRFAPLVTKLAATLPAGAKEFRYTVNAGPAAPGHWTLDPRVGGGRIVGEACHFIDLLRMLAGGAITSLEARASGEGAHLWITFAGGSTGVVDYLVSGDRSFPKERLEVFAAGRVFVLDNFRRLLSYPARPLDALRWPARQDKGQKAAVAAFIGCIQHGTPSPVGFDEIEEVSRWAIRAAEQL